MPRLRMTDRRLQSLRAEGPHQVDYFDERLPGFAMRVTTSGHKSWIVMYRHRGRVRRLTLGPYPALGLADARALAKEKLHDVASGRDPAAEKQSARRAETFEDLAKEYMDRHAKVRKRERCWKEDQRQIDRELLPRWKLRKACEIKRRDVQELLDAIVGRGSPIQANNTFALVRKMFNFAVQREIVDVSPCMGIGRPTRPRQRDRVLTYDEIRSLWKALDERPAIVADALRLELLTAQRGGEILSMRWEDVDLSSSSWTIPAMYAKNGRSHRVPLSPQVLAILGTRRDAGPQSPWVFPSVRVDGPVTTIMKDVQDLRTTLGFFFNPHDLRRTAASHMTAMGILRLTVSKLLNHVESGVTAIYDRYSYDREKRTALAAWGAEIEKIVSGVPSSPDSPDPSESIDRETMDLADADHPVTLH